MKFKEKESIKYHKHTTTILPSLFLMNFPMMNPKTGNATTYCDNNNKKTHNDNNNNNDGNFVFYKSYSLVLSETVLGFTTGALYGSIWGFITPFHPAGSPEAKLEMKTGIFKPAKLFSSYRAVLSNGAMIGSLMGVFTWGSCSMAYIRGNNNHDIIDFASGVGAASGYFRYFFWESDKRMILHNRVLGGTLATSIIYGMFHDVLI